MSASQHSLRRMHYRSDGTPKRPVSNSAAARMREQGWHTYLCPICNKTHGSRKGT